MKKNLPHRKSSFLKARQAMKKRPLILIPFIIFVAGLLSVLYSYLTRPEKETFLFPENFRGAVYVIYDQKNGEPKAYEHKRRLYKIPDNGILFTQFKAEYGRIDHEYYFVDSHGKRTEFVTNEEWISPKNAHNPQRDSAVVFRLSTGSGSSHQDSNAFSFTHFIVKTYNQPWQSGDGISFTKIDSIRTAYLKTK